MADGGNKNSMLEKKGEKEGMEAEKSKQRKVKVGTGER